MKCATRAKYACSLGADGLKNGGKHRAPPGSLTAGNETMRRTPISGPHRPLGRRTHEPRRAGVITLELLIALPIVLLILFGVIEFGLLFVNLQQVALACRVGAEEASQTTVLPLSDGDEVPENVVRAIEHQLLSSGIKHCRVRLEHNVGGVPVVLTSPQSPCDCGPTAVLQSPPPRNYVRVTVCVELREVMPDCLTIFGFSISDPPKTTGCTTVMRYELLPALN